VVTGVGAADAEYFQDLWTAAEVRGGRSADEAVSAVGDLLIEDGEAKAFALDLYE
jgi:hypothetical protein